MVATTRSSRRNVAMALSSSSSNSPSSTSASRKGRRTQAKTEAKKTATKPQNLKRPSTSVAPATLSPSKIQITTTAPSTTTTTSTPTTNNLLLSLPDDVLLGELRNRPSKRNRSPYVGDVWLPSEQREVICHLPNLDMGGKCRPGASLVMKPARDNKGNLVGPNAVSPKYGTPKCEFIAQLLRVDESALCPSSMLLYPPVWVGAHPSLGEKIAEKLVSHNLLGVDFPSVESFQREVRNPAGLDLRADFVVKHVDPTRPPRIVEVKTVVDTDYSSRHGTLPNRTKCVFTSDRQPYRRTGIFPWGNSNQKGPDGEPVVSARAIKHVRELTRMVQQQQKKKKNSNSDKEERDQVYDATILFVVVRHDAKAFRPNIDACPSFARYLNEARDAGVQILAKQVVWGEDSNGGQLGQCFEGDLLDIEWP